MVAETMLTASSREDAKRREHQEEEVQASFITCTRPYCSTCSKIAPRGPDWRTDLVINCPTSRTANTDSGLVGARNVRNAQATERPGKRSGLLTL